MITMNKVASYRKHKRLSQKQLASLVGVHPSYIALIELGLRKPSLDIALKLSRILGVPVEELFPVEEDAGDRE